MRAGSTGSYHLQTFLPLTDIRLSLRALDPKRRWNQINECIVLLKVHFDGAKPWSPHPACLMWEGHSAALLQYAQSAVDLVSEIDGRTHPGLAWQVGASEQNMPAWAFDERFRVAHRANLVRKSPEFYAPKFPGVEPDDVYVWPLLEGDTWLMREKRVGAKDYLPITRRIPTKRETSLCCSDPR